jgi:hypothetical protein
MVEELLEASRYIELYGGSPNDFEATLEAVTDEVCAFPEAWSRTGVGKTRKASVGWYEYHLIFESAPEEVFFVALAHKRREPMYWIHRLESGA